MTDIPATMRALVVKGEGFARAMTGPHIDDAADWLELAELPVPAPGPGQVLIRMRKAVVNPSDIHFIKGEYGLPREKGKPAGFEGCGDVVAAGEGADALLGKRVAFLVAPGGSGAWAEYALTHAAMCFPLRDDISDSDGASQLVNPLTAVALVDAAAASGNAFVVTAAASQLGLLMAGLARDRGLTMIATVRRAEAVERLRDAGAAVALNTNDTAFSEQLAEALRAHKPRVLLDAVADQASADLFFAMPAGTRWIVYGKLSAEAPTMRQMGQFVFMGKRVEGFWLSRWLQETPRAEVERAIGDVQARFASGSARTEVAAALPLDAAIAELPAALSRRGGKVMIECR